MEEKMFLEKDLSYKLVGCCFEVHNNIGGGHKEKMYQKVLAIEFSRREIVYQQQIPIDIKVHDYVVGKYILDFLVDDRIIIEIKSNRHFRMSDFRQANAYLQALNKQLALLVVFTTTHVRHKRVINLPTV